MNSAGKPQFFGHRVIHHIHLTKNIPKKVASTNRKQLNLQPDHVDPLTVRRATSTSSGYSPDPSRHSHLAAIG